MSAKNIMSDSWRIVDTPVTNQRFSTVSKGIFMYHIEPETELRLDIGSNGSTVVLELKTGSAEIFGTELSIGVPYELRSGVSVAVYTWLGCCVELKGKPDFEYVGKDTPMTSYWNAHVDLERRRAEAERFGCRGPVAMVVGSSDAGKSTLSRILLNYGVRAQRSMTFVDLNVEGGDICVPGTVGALLVSRAATVEEGFANRASLMYHFGHKSPNDNVELYESIETRMSKVISERLERNAAAKASGYIVNTHRWRVVEDSTALLIQTARTFGVDVVYVLGNEKLRQMLERDLPKSVNVVNLPKSGGVAIKSDEDRAKLEKLRIDRLFSSNISAPHIVKVKFDEININKIGVPALPASCLPIGMVIEGRSTKVVAVRPGPTLTRRLLAITFGSSAEEAATRNVAGFLCVTDVDAKNRTLTILSPHPSLPPTAMLFLSDAQSSD